MCFPVPVAGVCNTSARVRPNQGILSRPQIFSPKLPVPETSQAGYLRGIGDCEAASKLSL